MSPLCVDMYIYVCYKEKYADISINVVGIHVGIYVEFN